MLVSRREIFLFISPEIINATTQKKERSRDGRTNRKSKGKFTEYAVEISIPSSLELLKDISLKAHTFVNNTQLN